MSKSRSWDRQRKMAAVNMEEHHAAVIAEALAGVKVGLEQQEARIRDSCPSVGERVR